MSILKNAIGGVAVLLLAAAAPAYAQETKNYQYDALGRLTKVENVNGPNNGVKTDFTYDAANNRSNVTVTGATPKFVIVPLNGFTIIPISGV